ncbi:GNAT family [Colletotrichum tofieldiae]|nr:GNAT family [Colletotrichum tofieldiae]GKT97187.1 GNAT family protein [Colletotrichum tofieldiae]
MAIGLGNAFRSKRLEFRAIEDNEEDKPWFHEQIKSDPPIGVLVLNDEAGDNYRHHHRLAFLTISITLAHRNKGYGAEAINWAVGWAFQRANIHSIRLGCVEYNERGRHLYEILGFVLEGRLRKSHYHERKWWDVLLYSMLEDEWLALRGLEDKEVARNR